MGGIFERSLVGGHERRKRERTRGNVSVAVWCLEISRLPRLRGLDAHELFRGLSGAAGLGGLGREARDLGLAGRTKGIAGNHDAIFVLASQHCGARHVRRPVHPRECDGRDALGGSGVEGHCLSTRDATKGETRKSVLSDLLFLLVLLTQKTTQKASEESEHRR